MKIALAQINPVIGDFSGNCRLIRRYAEQARRRDCGLVVFPELALCGYPPLDFLERESFLADHDAALARLRSEIRGIGVLLGCLTRHANAPGKFLHNSAVLFENGEDLFTARKRLLPTYDVFDESRYFEAARRSHVCRFRGLRLGITICEDIWNVPELFPRPLYNVDPVAELTAAGVDLLINVAASPFHIGKDQFREKLFAATCRPAGLPFLYVNAVGGQDSLLFDGRSLALDPSGRTAARAARFREDLVVVDTDGWGGEIRPDDTAGLGQAAEIAKVYEALVMGVRDYSAKCGFSSGVLGLSGGIDSALTAAIACDALGPENILGVALPSRYTSPVSLEDAGQLAANLGCRFETVPIDAVFAGMLATLEPLFTGRPPDVTEENLQARIRGNLLMALSNKFGHLLLSTGNKSEMAVGYCTLYGDMSGGLGVIADVPKLLVYELARYLNRRGEIIPQRTLDKPPSAELAPDQRDDDVLPPYEVLDPILAAYLEEHRSIDEIVERGFDRRVVEDVALRVTVNEYKRKQAPPGLKVTSKAFGYGRRYPLAQRYHEGGKN